MKVMTERLKFADLFPEEAGKLAQRLHIKKDDIPFVRKYYTQEKQEVLKKERAVISYISTNTRDRDGDILEPEGVVLDHYRNNPVVFYNHDYRSIPIGKNIWIKKDDKGLIAKTVFAKSENADEKYRAYTEDIEGTGALLKAWSVGFIPLESEDIEVKANEKPGKRFKKWELLEYSAVGVPSCPEALTLAIEKGLVSERFKKDLEIELEVEDKVIEIDKLTEGLGKALKERGAEIIDKIIEVESDVGDKEFEMEVDVKGEHESYKIKSGEIITKPETTDNYHRIPVSTGHDGHKIRTKTISAEKGIKGLYCIDCKKFKTILFDTEKWSMEEAQAWIKEHRDSLRRYEGMMSKKEENTDSDVLVKEMALESKDKTIEIKEDASGNVATEEEAMEHKEEIIEAILEKEKDGGLISDASSNVVTEEFEKFTAIIKGQYDSIIAEKDGIIAELKEGRVLSRKNRKIVKDAITALNAVLKADSAGSREDEEDGKMVEIEKDIPIEGSFSQDDIRKIIHEVFDSKAEEIIKDAFEKSMDPEQIKSQISESVRLALQKIRGKVE